MSYWLTLGLLLDLPFGLSLVISRILGGDAPDRSAPAHAAKTLDRSLNPLAPGGKQGEPTVRWRATFEVAIRSNLSQIVRENVRQLADMIAATLER